MNNLYVSWTDVERYTNSLVNYIANNNLKFDGVYGLPRGGLVLAVILSHKLDIPLLMAPSKNSLVVDDIADSGKTLLHYNEKGYFISTMFYHTDSCVKPSYYSFNKHKNTWIIFPWEIRGEK